MTIKAVMVEALDTYIMVEKKVEIEEVFVSMYKPQVERHVDNENEAKDF